MFQNKTTIWNRPKHSTKNLFWRQSRLLFVENWKELEENPSQWFYLEPDQIKSLENRLSDQFLPNSARLEELEEKRRKQLDAFNESEKAELDAIEAKVAAHTPLNADEIARQPILTTKRDQAARLALTATELSQLQEFLDQENQIARLERLHRIKTDPELIKLSKYTTPELEKIRREKSAEATRAWRRLRSTKDTKYQAEVAKIQEEIDSIQEILDERELLSKSDAKKLEEELKSQNVSDLESTEKQSETMEQYMANSHERRKEFLQEWSDQIKNIRHLESIEKQIESLLKKIQTGQLQMSDKQNIHRIYQNLSDVYEKLKNDITLEKLESEADHQVAATLIQKLEQVRVQKREEQTVLLEKMDDDFTTRLDRLNLQWSEGNVHHLIEHHSEEFSQKITEAKDSLKELKQARTLDPSDPAYQALINKILKSEERQAHITKQRELLNKKEDSYRLNIEKVTQELQLLDWDGTSPFPLPDPNHLKVTESQARRKNLSIPLADQALENWLRTQEGGRHVGAIGNAQLQKELALANPRFRVVYDQSRKLKTHKTLLTSLETDLTRTLGTITTALTRLNNPDNVFFTEDDHYNMRLRFEDNLHNIEQKSIELFDYAKNAPALQELPNWEDLRDRFSGAYETRQKLFKRGAPKEQSPFELAKKEFQTIQDSNLLPEVKNLLSNPAIRMSDTEKAKQLENLTSIQESIGKIDGLQNSIDAFNPDKYAEFFKNPEAPHQEGVLLELKKYVEDFEASINEANDIIKKTNKLHDKVRRFHFDLKTHLDNQNDISTGEVYRWARIDDIVELVKMFDEWWRKDYNRKKKGRTGEIGKVLFDLPVLYTLAHDSELQVEQAENEAVNQYKEMFDLMDAWRIQNELKTLKNQDYLKAALKSLSDKGRLRFDNPDLLNALSNFSGGAVHFDTSPDGLERETDDYVRLEDKIRRAMIVIWGDEDMFSDIKHANEGALKKRIDGFQDKAAQLAGNETGLGETCSLMLKEWIRYQKKGQVPPGFDPAEYECYIRYGVMAGKMDPHAKFWFLIQGVRHGIMSRARFGAMSQEFAGDYPVMEFFDSHPPIDLVYHWADTLDSPTGNPPSYGPGLKFYTWYHAFLLQDPTVNERLNKIWSEGRKDIDHDEAVAMVTGLAEDGITTSLRWQSSRGKFPETALQNMACGMLFGMQVKSMQLNKYPKTSDRDIKRFIGTWIRFNAITNNLMFQGSDQYARFNSENINGIPRVAGMFVHKHKNTKFYMEKMKDYVSMLDPELFNIIFDRAKFTKRGNEKIFNENLKKVVDHLKENYAEWNLFAERAVPTEPDHVFEMMGDIVNAVIEKGAKTGVLKQMMNKIQTELVSESQEAANIIGNPPPPPFTPGESDAGRVQPVQQPVNRYNTGPFAMPDAA